MFIIKVVNKDTIIEIIIDAKKIIGIFANLMYILIHIIYNITDSNPPIMKNIYCFLLPPPHFALLLCYISYSFSTSHFS